VDGTWGCEYYKVMVTVIVSDIDLWRVILKWMKENPLFRKSIIEDGTHEGSDWSEREITLSFFAWLRQKTEWHGVEMLVLARVFLCLVNLKPFI
jgi:hypothetical protein